MTPRATRGLAQLQRDIGMRSCVLCFSNRRAVPRAQYGGHRLCPDCADVPLSPVAAILGLLELTHEEVAGMLGIGRLAVLRACHGRPIRRRPALALHRLTRLPVEVLMAGTTDLGWLSRRGPPT